MTKGWKDSAKAIEFMTLFARLKLHCDEPENVLEDAESDSAVRELCSSLWFSKFMISMEEKVHREFYTNVDPAFLAAWREYEDRWDRVVSHAANLLGESKDRDLPAPPTLDRDWDFADSEGEEQAGMIAELIRFAENETDQDDLWDDSQEGWLQRLYEGRLAWRQLTLRNGLDLRGIIRRRELVPFVLVPRQIAARYSNTEQLSMLRNLRDVHDAFVFGATHAALALMRSIMEAALRDHYAADGRDLCEQIDNARSLPPAASRAALHRLRLLSNSILHLDREKDQRLTKLSAVDLEKEIVSLLRVLRALIEGGK